MSVRSKARTLAIALAFVLAALATPPVARASFDPDSPPAGAYTQTEGPRYWVGEVDIRYAEDHPLHPPVDLIRAGQYATGVRDLCEQVVNELGQRGLIGVYVAPDPAQIDPDTGADLRGDDTRLTLVIHTGRVRSVRTFTAGEGTPV